MNLTIKHKSFLADRYTPVGIYLSIRDKYENSILLESSDYHGNEHHYSYICFDSIADFKVEKNEIKTSYLNKKSETKTIKEGKDVTQALKAFANSFKGEKPDLPFMSNMILGYSTYESVQYFEDIQLSAEIESKREIPTLYYQLFRYNLVLNHTSSRLTIIENIPEGESTTINEIIDYLTRPKEVKATTFNTIGDIESNLSDDEYKSIVDKGIEHCLRGDVFQIVLSRRFSQKYRGDIFKVYRSLRSVNPSPYLFYFNYKDFQIVGSSPEAQLVVANNKAIIHPIAGTFKRTGNDRKDYDLAKKLFDDPKENSEHVMLVDLARNDLSRHGDNVKVTSFKDIQYYSHVIHLVSTVEAELENHDDSLQLYADTFPAGTLSGAPKHNAMTLIDKYETGHRSFYGGAIGAIGFDGNINQAIMIRTLLSKDGELHYQAGAGVVAKSNRDSELQEVNNKLGALKKAIEQTM